MSSNCHLIVDQYLSSLTGHALDINTQVAMMYLRLGRQSIVQLSQRMWVLSRVSWQHLIFMHAGFSLHVLNSKQVTFFFLWIAFLCALQPKFAYWWRMLVLRLALGVSHQRWWHGISSQYSSSSCTIMVCLQYTQLDRATAAVLHSLM